MARGTGREAKQPAAGRLATRPDNTSPPGLGNPYDLTRQVWEPPERAIRDRFLLRGIDGFESMTQAGCYNGRSLWSRADRLHALNQRVRQTLNAGEAAQVPSNLHTVPRLMGPPKTGCFTFPGERSPRRAGAPAGGFPRPGLRCAGAVLAYRPVYEGLAASFWAVVVLAW